MVEDRPDVPTGAATATTAAAAAAVLDRLPGVLFSGKPISQRGTTDAVIPAAAAAAAVLTRPAAGGGGGSGAAVGGRVPSDRELRGGGVLSPPLQVGGNGERETQIRA